jgi:hypothetical protein
MKLLFSSKNNALFPAMTGIEMNNNTPVQMPNFAQRLSIP